MYINGRLHNGCCFNSIFKNKNSEFFKDKFQYFICYRYFLFFGAVGKAQSSLHTWLPDALY
jgi:NADH:ubiquinone oxidoreductase subunit 5 (subunit L)/multisubunit Na+/H+ antiporter MnhA subunit